MKAENGENSNGTAENGEKTNGTADVKTENGINGHNGSEIKSDCSLFLNFPAAISISFVQYLNFLFSK